MELCRPTHRFRGGCALAYALSQFCGGWFFFGMFHIEMLVFVWLLHVVAMSTWVRDAGRFVPVFFSIRFRSCELHSFSRRWLKSCGNTMQHIYVSDALLFLCVHLFSGCVRARLFCVVWIACAFRSVRVAFVN